MSYLIVKRTVRWLQERHLFFFFFFLPRLKQSENCAWNCLCQRAVFPIICLGNVAITARQTRVERSQEEIGLELSITPGGGGTGEPAGAKWQISKITRPIFFSLVASLLLFSSFAPDSTSSPSTTCSLFVCVEFRSCLGLL